MPTLSAFPHDPCNDCAGLSKREWFAGLALQGMLAQGRWTKVPDSVGQITANAAVEFADALLLALETPK